jgi:hypothetical protein
MTINVAYTNEDIHVGSLWHVRSWLLWLGCVICGSEPHLQLGPLLLPPHQTLRVQAMLNSIGPNRPVLYVLDRYDWRFMAPYRRRAFDETAPTFANERHLDDVRATTAFDSTMSHSYLYQIASYVDCPLHATSIYISRMGDYCLSHMYR